MSFVNLSKVLLMLGLGRGFSMRNFRPFHRSASKVGIVTMFRFVNLDGHLSMTKTSSNPPLIMRIGNLSS